MNFKLGRLEGEAVGIMIRVVFVERSVIVKFEWGFGVFVILIGLDYLN